MVFMGDFLVNTGTKMSNADEAQAHYSRLMKGFLGRVFLYRANLKSVAKDAGSERAFWTLARDKVFKKEPVWQEQVQRQLEALGEGGQ